MAADEDQQKNSAPSHLLVFHTVTAGKNGEKLGSDEEQIVLMTYLLYDVANRKVSLMSFKIYCLRTWKCKWFIVLINDHDNDRC